MHMKFGTILYCRGIDILVRLSWALSAQSTLEETVVLAHITPTKQQSDKVTVLHDAAYLVNDLIHEEIDRQSTVKSSPISFDIDSEFIQINPLLLKFINSITATVRERKPPVLGKPIDSNKHLKKERIYNILGLLQFCTNPYRPLPIHDLIADVVEICGGPRQLLRIFNRLGCTSSPDTHDRFITQHASDQRTKGLWNEFPVVFTDASIDNFDMLLLSIVAISIGVITAQVIQPNPELEVRCDNEMCVSTTVLPFMCSEQQEVPNQPQSSNPSDNFAALSKCTLQQMPGSSPHKVAKRLRTIQVKNLSCSLSKDTTTYTTQLYTPIH